MAKSLYPYDQFLLEEYKDMDIISSSILCYTVSPLSTRAGKETSSPANPSTEASPSPCTSAHAYGWFMCSSKKRQPTLHPPLSHWSRRTTRTSTGIGTQTSPEPEDSTWVSSSRPHEHILNLCSVLLLEARTMSGYKIKIVDIGDHFRIGISNSIYATLGIRDLLIRTKSRLQNVFVPKSGWTIN